MRDAVPVYGPSGLGSGRVALFEEFLNEKPSSAPIQLLNDFLDFFEAVFDG